MNHEIEQALRQQLKRKQPKPDFAARVMARLPEATPEPRKVIAMPARRPWLAIAMAASLALGSFAGLRYQQYRQGQEAKRQLLLALQITGEKLTLAQHKVVGISERRIDQ